MSNQSTFPLSNQAKNQRKSDQKDSDFSELKKVLKNKRRELSRFGQQLGIPGLKGKGSINQKSVQRRKVAKELLSSIGISKPPERSKSQPKSEKYFLEQFTPDFFLNSEQKETRAIRKSIERKLKKEKGVHWCPQNQLKEKIEFLTNKKIPLSERSSKTWEWVHNLKPTEFSSGSVAIKPAEIKGLSHGFNRFQCTEVFICYFKPVLFAQSKSKFILKKEKNYISHLGFNNSYAYMGWAKKQIKLMKKVSCRLKALNWIKLYEIKREIHKKSGKFFYKLIFKSLNKWSKSLTEDQKKRAKALVRKNYMRRGLDPPSPVFLLGLNLKI